MWILVTAVVSASLLGSMHCVGMCGPLAIWASGGGNLAGREVFQATLLYHVGRLTTYLMAGLAAGLVGHWVDLGGQLLGIQLLAARLVGSLMVAAGLFRLVNLLAIHSSWRLPTKLTMLWSSNANNSPSLVARALMWLRPSIMRLPLQVRGLVTGLLTVLLPCGWLYLFALVAAGTGSLVMGPIVMLSFWIGTVPALIGLVAGTLALASRFRAIVPAIASVVIIVGGMYTFSGRGFAALHSLRDIQVSSSLVVPSSECSETISDQDIEDELQRLTSTPLPCCIEHGVKKESP